MALETTDDAVLAAITGFRPRTVDARVADFARTVVTTAAPANVSRARALLFAAAKLGCFCSSVGCELDPERCLHPSIVERFIVVGTSEMTSPTRRTLRSNLRHLADKVVPELRPAPAPLSRERAKPPYSSSQIASYLALCDAQPRLARRHRLGALICLGAGAGLVGGELRCLRGCDVVCRSGGVLVLVAGRRPRAVPVLGAFHERLLAAAAFAGEHYLVGGNDAARRNVTSRLVASRAGGADLARLDIGRLRSTWLCAAAETIGLRAFMDAAGITCSQRLGDLVAGLSPPSEEEAVALLGGRR